MSEPQQEQVFRWEFHSVKEMRRALEEYLDFLDNTVVTRYSPGTGGDPDPKAHMNAMRRRSEIDACMDVLQLTSPFLWRLIDVHFRRGAGIEPQDWRTTAACVGLRRVRCPQGVRCTLPGAATKETRADVPPCTARHGLRCQEDRELLQQHLAMAVRRLYEIHEDRCAH